MKTDDKNKSNRFETLKAKTDNEGLKRSIEEKQKHFANHKPVNK